MAHQHSDPDTETEFTSSLFREAGNIQGDSKINVLVKLIKYSLLYSDIQVIY